jgi:hypothetical protein
MCAARKLLQIFAMVKAYPSMVLEVRPLAIPAPQIKVIPPRLYEHKTGLLIPGIDGDVSDESSETGESLQQTRREQGYGGGSGVGA